MDGASCIPARIDRQKVYLPVAVGHLVATQEFCPGRGHVSSSASGVISGFIGVNSFRVAMPYVDIRACEDGAIVIRIHHRDGKSERRARAGGAGGRIGPNVGPKEMLLNPIWPFCDSRGVDGTCALHLRPRFLNLDFIMTRLQFQSVKPVRPTHYQAARKPAPAPLSSKILLRLLLLGVAAWWGHAFAIRHVAPEVRPRSIRERSDPGARRRLSRMALAVLFSEGRGVPVKASGGLPAPTGNG